MPLSSSEYRRHGSLADNGVAIVRGAPEPWVPNSLAHSLEAVAKWAPNQVAFEHGGESLSYAQLLERSNALAAGLVHLGAEPGQPAALLLDNSLEWIVCFYALAMAGIPVVPINTRFVVDEIAFVLEHSRAAASIAGQEYGRSKLTETLEKLDLSRGASGTASVRFPDLHHVIQVGGTPADGCVAWDQLFRPVAEVIRRGGPDSIGLVQFTSGTTGFPKGVMLSQDQILHNAYSVGTRLAVRPGDVMYSPMPFFHVGGAVLSILMTAIRGATLVFPKRFAAAEMLSSIDKYQCTLTAGVETMLLSLLEHPNAAGFSGGSLRGAWGAGTDAIFDFLPGFVNIYGLSENSPNAAMAYADDPLRWRRDSCGWVQPGIELGIADPAVDGPGPWLSVGEVGEIRIRGWSVMQGYINDPEATAETVDADGWLHTGDLGAIDEFGAVHFEGRLKDTVRIGGEVISAGEIERVLERHERVRAAHVVAIADDQYGEVPIAFIETSDGSWNDALEQDLAHLAAEGLASFKVPRHYQLCETAPTTESGKVQKRLLVERYLSGDDQ